MDAILERRADGTRVATTVLRRAPQVEPIPTRATGDNANRRWGIPVFLRLPRELHAVPGEAFAVTLLR